MKTVNIDFTDSTIGTLGRAGEHNNTAVVCSLTPEFVKCDLMNAEISNANGEKISVEGEFNEEKNTFTVMLTKQLTVEGEIKIQLIGYVTQEGSDEPQIIVKSPVVSGVITPSINGIETQADSNPSLLDRIWTKIQAWADKIHTHSNKNVLDTITTDSLSGEKTIVENKAIRFSGALDSSKITVFENPMERIAINGFLNTSGTNTIPEYVFVFESGHAGFPTRLSMPKNVQWANGDVPDIKYGYRYVIRIFDDIASYEEVEV